MTCSTSGNRGRKCLPLERFGQLNRLIDAANHDEIDILGDASTATDRSGQATDQRMRQLPATEVNRPMSRRTVFSVSFTIPFIQNQERRIQIYA